MKRDPYFYYQVDGTQKKILITFSYKILKMG